MNHWSIHRMFRDRKKLRANRWRNQATVFLKNREIHFLEVNSEVSQKTTYGDDKS